MIATYPTEKVLKHFKSLFRKHVQPSLVEEPMFPENSQKVYDFAELSDEDEEISPLMMVCVPATDEKDAERLVKVFTDELVKTGYYMSSYDICKTSRCLFVYIQFEAKYTNMLVDLADVLYHVSPLKNLQKILKNGLVPYSKANSFKYDDRIYLFNKCDKATVYDYAIYKTIEAKDTGFCVFTVFKSKLLDDPLFKDGKQKFYLDPAFSLSDSKTDQTAIFTRINVPLRILSKQYVVVKLDDTGNIGSEETKSL